MSKRLPEARLSLSSRLFLILALFLLPLIGVGTYAGASTVTVILRLAVDGSVLVLWLLSAIGIGTNVLACFKLKQKSMSGPLRYATAAALGLGIISLLTLGLGLAGILDRAIAWGIIGVGIALYGWRLRSREKWTDLVNWLAEPAGLDWLWLLAVPFLAMALTAAMTPPGFLWPGEPHPYDVVEYHLQIPREWYEAHRIVPLHHNIFSFVPFNVEMHYLLAMHLAGGPWAGMYLAQLMHLTFMALTIVAIHGFARQRAPKLLAIVAAMLLLTVPWLLQLSTIAYDEGGFLLFATLAIGWTAIAIQRNSLSPVIGGEGRGEGRLEEGRYSKDDPSPQPSPPNTGEREQAKRLALAGAMAGFAAGSKLTAVPEVIAAIPIVVACIAMFTTFRKGWLARPKFAVGLVLFCLMATTTFSPWFVRNFAWTRNPIFPELMPVLGHGDLTAAQVERWDLSLKPPPAERSMKARHDKFLKDVLFGWQFGYLVVPLGFIAFALSIRQPQSWFLLGLLLILIFFWLRMTHLQARFFVLAIPLCALLIAQIELEWMPLVLIGLVPVAMIHSWVRTNSVFAERLYSATNERNSIVAVLGQDGRELFQQIFIPDELPKDAPEVLVGEARAFWFPIPMSRLRYRTVFDVRDGKDLVSAWIGPEGRKPGEWMLVDPAELKRFSTTYHGLPPVPAEVTGRSQQYLEKPISGK